MLSQPSFRPFPEMRFASRHMQRAVSALHTPRQNHLLAALPLKVYARLLPALEPVPLPLGWTLHGAGEREKHVYFLTAGIVSRFCVMQNGESAEFAVTGCEGVIGVASFLGGESTTSNAKVISDGYAYRLPAGLLNNEFEHEVALQQIMLRYTLALIAQIGQIAACNRHHPLERRLCHWLLSCLDRLPSNELSMTQDLIADMLGVRREGVTEAAGELQRAGLIHYSRGHIAVIDRHRLQARVCECYAVVKRAYDRLLHPEKNIRNAGVYVTCRQ